MNTAPININRNSFFAILQMMNRDDKMEIYRFLKKNLFKQKMENVLQSFRTDELSMEDITQAVEEVRQDRYEKGKQIL